MRSKTLVKTEYFNKIRGIIEKLQRAGRGPQVANGESKRRIQQGTMKTSDLICKGRGGNDKGTE